jgi:hypothetical protein
MLLLAIREEKRHSLVPGTMIAVCRVQGSDHMWQALIRGESHRLVMGGVEIRSGHVRGEIQVYGPYHLKNDVVPMCRRRLGL